LSSLFTLTIYFRSDQILFSILLLAIEPAELKKLQNNYLFWRITNWVRLNTVCWSFHLGNILRRFKQRWQLVSDDAVSDRYASGI